MNPLDRRIGLEQEFFLVNATGEICDRADEFLQACHAAALRSSSPGGVVEGRKPEYFAPEFVKSMIEINTPPAYSVSELAAEYLSNLKLALEVGRDLDLRLYPLSQYPLHFDPVIRDEPNYHIQARTVGYDRFLNAGRCIGTHLHLELPAGSIDSRIGVSYETTPEARAEVLNLYNLATALDPALIALSRACPFYEGKVLGLAARTVHYRGSEVFGWEGVYTHLQQVGGLQPYATSIVDLVEMQFARYYAWLEAMDRAGVERHLFLDAGGNLLKSAWSPVRLNAHGTVELRGTDSDYPQVILTIATLVYNAADRVRRDALTVQPMEGVRTLEVRDRQLYVPDFEYLNGALLYAAATEGVKHPDVIAYLTSILNFAAQTNSEGAADLEALSASLTTYQTTEASILQSVAPATGEISRGEGLQLVRQVCDTLEAQVFSLYHQHSLSKLLNVGCDK